MGDPYVREVGRVVTTDGQPLVVGVEYDAVTLGPSSYTEPIWRLTRDQVDDFGRAFVTACWEAGENARRMGEEVHEADGGDSMAGCDAEDKEYLCTETGPHRVHLARDTTGTILHAWDRQAGHA